MSKIIQLRASNVKRIQAVQITPTGALVSIGGMNGQGKSSVLDAIEMAIAGAAKIPEMPVRKGEEKAVISVELDDLRIRRTISPNGNTTLTVTNKEGVKYTSPQSVLDALLGKLGFDPLAFARQKPEAQYETLRTLANLDFTQADKKRADLYEARTALGREIKTLEGQMAGLPSHPDAPAEEVKTVDIMEKWRAAESVNEANNKVRAELQRLKDQRETAELNVDNANAVVADIQSQIDNLNVRLEAARQNIKLRRERLAELEDSVNSKAKEIAALKDENVDTFKSQIQEAETTNRKVRQNQARAVVSKSLIEKRQSYDDATLAIDDLDSNKRKLIAQSKLPVDGLSFDAGKVLFNGIPFSQASTADQLKVSVAVGIALNPKLKVLFIRDGSLLDENNLKLMAEMAEKHGAQIWMERVGANAEVGVVIEDGRVKGAPLEPEPVVEEKAEQPAVEAEPVNHTPADGQVNAAMAGRKKKVRATLGQEELIP